jgi:MinD-like ATPase involved in chromosome partitioning or flagellar assembly
MLVCFWSPKGGSGTSVITAAAALVLARDRPDVRVADLTGDLPAVLALANDPAVGLHDWLRTGVDAPVDALDRLTVDAGTVGLLPAGEPGIASLAPEAGAALAVALRDDPRPTMCDCGRADAPVLRAVAEVADACVVVVRPCYLALRSALQHPALAFTSGVVLIEEHGRSLGFHDVGDVLGVPMLARIEARTSTARAVDAGTLVSRLPDSVARPLRAALVHLGISGGERAA